MVRDLDVPLYVWNLADEAEALIRRPLAGDWPCCWRGIKRVSRAYGAELILLDDGPTGGINHGRKLGVVDRGGAVQVCVRAMHELAEYLARTDHMTDAAHYIEPRVPHWVALLVEVRYEPVLRAYVDADDEAHATALIMRERRRLKVPSPEEYVLDEWAEVQEA